MDPQETFVIRLRRYREHYRISLDQIAAATRIKRELLEAFERNDLTEWPRGLYARARIRAYAEAVGLDPDDTVDDFCRLFPHGDRRAGATIHDIAAIVAHASEYRDEFSHPMDRRAPLDAPDKSAWQTYFARGAQALVMRLASLKAWPAPRLKRTPGARA